MLTIQESIRLFLRKYKPNKKSRKIAINWIKKDSSWISQQFSGNSIKPNLNIYSQKIENLAQKTNSLGAQPLWEGYGDNNIGGSTRRPDGVRTPAIIGDLYTYLVQQRKPEIVVEFGTAFGVSGMYFLAGLNINNKGKLLTFEPNEVWAKLARNNLSEISNKFELTIGTFEENIDKVLPKNQSIDIAFIDAIHTKEFVMSQLDIVVSRSSSKAIIILDDINFSDSMKECWKEVSTDSRFSGSAIFNNRIGIVELR
jgi:predicted O-methyltransferase YrrM